MPEHENLSNLSSLTADAQSRRRRMAFIGLPANLVIVLSLAVLWFKSQLTLQELAMLALPMFLVVNGALWLGSRRSGQRMKVRRQTQIFFVVGGAAAIMAILDLTGGDYGSAVITGTISISMVGLGVIANRKKNPRVDV